MTKSYGHALCYDQAKHGMSWFATLWKSAPPAANQALDQAPGEDGAAQAQEDGPGSPVTGEGGFASFKERRVQRMSLGTTGSLADWQEDHDMELVALDSPWTTYGGAAPRQVRAGASGRGTACHCKRCPSRVALGGLHFIRRQPSLGFETLGGTFPTQRQAGL